MSTIIEIDIHDLEPKIAAARVRSSIKTIGKNILVFVHGYGSSGGSYIKLTETRNIGRSRVKKRELSVSVSGPELNDPLNRAKFGYEDMSKLNQYVMNNGVTIMKK